MAELKGDNVVDPMGVSQGEGEYHQRLGDMNLIRELMDPSDRAGNDIRQQLAQKKKHARPVKEFIENHGV